MAIIQFKRGTTGPTGLTLGEPAWDYSNNRFYIGVTSEAIWVGAGITTGDINNGSTNLIPTQSAVKAYVDANAGTSVAGVTLLNGFTGAITITGGTGISVTQSGKDIQIKNILNTLMNLIEGVTFTETTTYTIPSGAKIIYGQCIGAGGGGAGGGLVAGLGGVNPGRGGGGGAGGAFYHFIIPDAASIGATCTVVIGQGGVGGLCGGVGSDGGLSQFHNNYFPGSPGGDNSLSGNLGYFPIREVVKSFNFNKIEGQFGSTPAACYVCGAGAASRATSNAVGYWGRRGYYGGGGGGGGAPLSASSGNVGGSGGSSSNNPLDVAQTTPGFTLGWILGGGGMGGAANAQPGTKGADGTLEYGGAGGGGGGSGSPLSGRGGDGGYPGGGGGGGGGVSGGNTAAPGGTGGNARIMIWVYG